MAMMQPSGVSPEESGIFEFIGSLEKGGVPPSQYADLFAYRRDALMPVLNSVSDLKYRVVNMPEERRLFADLMLAKGTYQLNCAAAWAEVNVAGMRRRFHQLTDYLKRWSSYQRQQGGPPPTMPLSRDSARLERVECQRFITKWERKIRDAKEKGCFYSVLPLLEFREQGVGDRRESGFPEHLLPEILLRAYYEFLNFLPEGIGYAHTQAVMSMQMMGGWNQQREQAAPPGFFRRGQPQLPPAQQQQLGEPYKGSGLF